MTDAPVMAIIGAFAFLLASGPLAEDPGVAYEPGSDEAAVWALEERIYQRRAVGDSRFYPSIASEHYLGWPAPAAIPIGKRWLTDFRDSGEFQPGEVIKVWSNGISVDGDTAISYFSTHRTRLPGGKAVDQRYENIHVWVRRGNSWDLVGSMSRKLTPEDLTRTYGLPKENNADER